MGAKQKQLGAGSMQLLHRSCPLSSLILAAVVVLLEPITPGPSQSPQDTITGFPYTLANLSTILVSAALGLAVSLSTFLVIGSTSSLTYNVVGHIKTVIIITGGVTIFGEDLPPKKVGANHRTLRDVAGCGEGQLRRARQGVVPLKASA